MIHNTWYKQCEHKETESQDQCQSSTAIQTTLGAALAHGGVGRHENSTDLTQEMSTAVEATQVDLINQILSIQNEINQKLIAISESLVVQSSFANSLATQVQEHAPYLKVLGRSSNLDSRLGMSSRLALVRLQPQRS